MLYHIEFDVEIPPEIECTDKDIREWLKFSFRDNGCCSLKNPLYAELGDAEPYRNTFDAERR